MADNAPCGKSMLSALAPVLRHEQHQEQDKKGETE
jgi:hypothetical protein